MQDVTFCDNIIDGIQKKNKFNIDEVLEKLKIYPERKVRMNIMLHRLIAMLVVRLTLKIDALKMEHAFQMGYKEGEKVFFVSPPIGRVRRWEFPHLWIL
jgi:hypothetical protein